MDLKDILENFVKYKEQLDDIERNGSDYSSVETYEKQFMKLRDVSYRHKQDGFCTTVEGEKRCNSSRNRYKDIVPFDHTRVKLSEPSGDPPSDYINASYIKGVTPSQRYIAAQGPMPDTVIDFWKMLWDNDVKIVVMACNEYEGSPRRLRCQRYWATDVNETLDIGNVSITLVKEQKGNYDAYVIRHLKATRNGETRELIHIHYMEFPDRGIPKCVPSLLDMIELMRELQPANSPDAPPVVIHCSAGCGRTGTIIVADYIWNMLKSGKVKQDFSIYDVIGEMRKQRMAIVQSLEQYVCVHDAVVIMFSRQLELMQEHNDYYNCVPKLSPTSQPSVSSEYEVLEVFERDAGKDSRKPVVPGTPPTPTAKPRAAAAGNIAVRPERHRKPSPVSPKPNSRSASQSDISADKPASPADQSTAIYATPFGGPPVIVKKPAGGSETASTREFLGIPQAAKPNASTSTGVDARKFQDYTTSKTSHTLPALSTGSSVYSEIDRSQHPRSPSAGGNSGGNSTSSQSPAPYEYADPNAVGKWSLQHIARGNPVDCVYATIPDAYSEATYSTDKAAEAHTEDTKPIVSSSGDSSSVVAGSAFAARKARIINLFTKPAPDISSFTSDGQPVRVTHGGEDISFPNRVARPKYGKRPLKLILNVK